MNRKAILVDLDGVIRQWPSTEPIEREYGLPVGALFSVAFSAELLHLAITGKISDPEWRALTIYKLQEKFPAALAAEAVTAWSRPAGMVDHEVLNVLRKSSVGLPLVLVTNATSQLPIDLKRLGLEATFSAVINSSEVGFAKPSAEIFQAALKAAGIEANEAIFIDDSLSNVQGAEALGIRAHHFTGAGALISFLEGFQ
jgi:putative hydrolase of the HAD superfamily